MIKDFGINEYEFPEAKSIVVSGDIHGDFNMLINKVFIQYQMQDTLVIVAGHLFKVGKYFTTEPFGE